jgi:hypothetical protein
MWRAYVALHKTKATFWLSVPSGLQSAIPRDLCGVQRRLDMITHRDYPECVIVEIKIA